MKDKKMIDIPEVIKRAAAHGLHINMDDSPNAVVLKLLEHLDELGTREVRDEQIIW